MRRPVLGWVQPEDHQAYRDWDAFVARSERGHYCQLSTFLRSYRQLGMKSDLLLARDPIAHTIVGGCGLLHLDRPVFRLTIAPICPLVEPGYESSADAIVNSAVERARQHGSSFVQLHLASSETAAAPGLLSATELGTLPRSEAGAVFTNGAAHTDMLWLEFPDEADDSAWDEAMLARFSKHHRRAIRRVERSSLQAREATSKADLREAYAVIAENARLRGYALRDWEYFGTTLVEQVQSGQAVVITAWHEGSILGAVYCVVAGRRLTYELGGILLRGRDLSTGFFLQWTAMQTARRLGLTGYDLGSPTSPSVMRFKSGFNPQHIELVEPRYVVFSRARFRLFTAVYPLATRHRRHVLRALRAATPSRAAQTPCVLPVLETLPLLI